MPPLGEGRAVIGHGDEDGVPLALACLRRVEPLPLAHFRRRRFLDLDFPRRFSASKGMSEELNHAISETIAVLHWAGGRVPTFQRTTWNIPITSSANEVSGRRFTTTLHHVH